VSLYRYDSLSQPAGAASKSTILPSQSVPEAQTGKPIGVCRLADSSLGEGAFWGLGDRVLFNYTEGPDVKELQEALISLGYSCGVYGADGEFGDCTEMAVRVFQTAKGVPVTGQYDAATHGALTEALLNAKPEAQDEKARHVEIQKNKKCYIRAAPNTGGKILGVAYGEERFEYRGTTYENGWHAITHKGWEAFVSGKYGKLVE